MRTALLDTCVLVPSRLRDVLLDASGAGLYTCRWSDDILRELTNVLSRIRTQDDAELRAERLLAATRTLL